MIKTDLCSSEVFSMAVRTLSRLGITANYSGFHYAACAISLAAEKPERLQLVTKWLYPDVAKKYGTDADSVRKNIAKVCALAWVRNPHLLSEMAMYRLKKKPGTGEFLAIVAVYLICQNELHD